MPDYLKYKDSRLFWLGQDMLEKSKKYNSSVIFFSKKRFFDNLQNAFSLGKKIQVHYAWKAHYRNDLIDILNKMSAGVEIMSGKEFLDVTSAGMLPENIIFNGVGRDIKALHLAIKSGVKAIVVDNITELDKISKECMALQKNTRVFFRFYPFWNNHFRPTSFIKFEYKLGIQNKEELNEMLKIVYSNRFLELSGLSFHFAVRNSDGFLHKAGFDNITYFYRNLRNDFKTLKYISIGGGLDSRYLIERKGFSIRSLLGSIAEKADIMDELEELIIEPGRFLINDCFIGISTINSVKVLNSFNWYIIDLSTNFLVPRANSYFEVFPIIKKETSRKEAKFGDGICSSSSIIGNSLFLPEMEIGDKVCILNCGAYTQNLASSFGFELPEIIEI